MACGTPVVAYPLGGARELLDLHPVTMRATRPDGQALADAVVALQKDEAEQRRLYHEGLHFVREQASLDAYVSALEVELLQARTHRGQAAPGGLRPVG
jgi:glycosyltransferase involved in cell wall biosynthesis